MNKVDELKRENAVLREQISKLSAASLRISGSLDLETVLREVVENACTMTGARYGLIVTVDESGLPKDFVTFGLTDEEHHRLADWSDGPKLFEHFRELQGVLNQPDISAYVKSLGFDKNKLPSSSFQSLGAPMRNRDRYLGGFYLVGKKGRVKFTSEDEKILLLFAAQAATAIANANTHRAEQRARTHLEALVETSPVGVAVFDARSANPVSFNQEATRIVESLCTPDCPPEALLELIICRRSDGREIALHELPLSAVLNTAETVRAEEIVLTVPDGRNVSTLINCTPINSEQGEVASVIVTMQDLEPLRELERLRAEFLGMVSHELRTPLTSIKGSAVTLLESSTRLDPEEMRGFFRIILAQVDHMHVLISDLLDVGRINAGTLSVIPESCDLSALVDSARMTFLSGGNRHTVNIDLPPVLPRVLADRQRIEQVLNNLFSNAAQHTPESFSIRVSAERNDAHVAVSVRDDGSGVAPDQLPYLFRKYAGIRDADGASRITHSGLGLAICKGLVEAHGGRIWADSPGVGQGTCVTFTILVTEETSVVARNQDPNEAYNIDETRNRTSILVVDDDPQTLHSVRDPLTEAGYNAIVTADSSKLSSLIQSERPALVLLDLLLPGTDGIELMEKVPELADQPVIFISAYGRDETIAKALDAGAADYIVKPFSSTVLVARIRSALRRRDDSDLFVLGDLTIDYGRRSVSLAGVRVDLTNTEYELLRTLSLRVGRVLTFGFIIRRVWRQRVYANPKLLHVFIKKQRGKLNDDAKKPKFILSERGVGYRMVQPDV